MNNAQKRDRKPPVRPFGTLCSSNPSESREADEELNRSAVFKSTEQTFEVYQR